MSAALLTLPEHMRESVAGWIERGEPHPDSMGSFLRAQLSGNTMAAIRAADYPNTRALARWEIFLARHAPPECHGSPARVLDWWRRHHP